MSQSALELGTPPHPVGEDRAAGAAAMHVAGQLQSAAERLGTALGLDRRDARLEAQILAARALGVERAWLIGHDRDFLDAERSARLDAFVARRAAGEPVAYILGEKEFYGRLFKVTPDVLIPRPETELLVDAALARLPSDRPAKILDLGTGSGCIAVSLALARPDCAVTAVDRSPAALAVARENGRCLCRGVDAAVRFLVSDWFDALAGARFDLVVSNPPYVATADAHLAQGDLRFEPVSALASGVQGLDDIRQLVARAPDFLTPGGVFLFEHGRDQGAACRGLMLAAGFDAVTTLTDLAGLDRITVGRRPGRA